MDDTEVFFKFCEEHWAYARQSEDQRTAFTNIVLLIASIIIGLISNRGLAYEVLPLTMLLILLGIVGAIASEKLYERHQYHSGRASAYGKRIRDLHPDATLDEYRKKAEETHNAQFSKPHKMRLHHLWLILHLSIALAGVILSILILR
jgi:hypothetical protein